MCIAGFLLGGGGGGAEGGNFPPPPLTKFAPSALPLKMTNVICYICARMNIGALNMFAPLDFYFHHPPPPLLNTLKETLFGMLLLLYKSVVSEFN